MISVLIISVFIYRAIRHPADLAGMVSVFVVFVFEYGAVRRIYNLADMDIVFVKAMDNDSAVLQSGF